MSGETVDLFKTRDHVADFDNYLLEYTRRSEHTRASHRSRLNICYGEEAGEKLDLFFPAEVRAPCPIHLFVHGGYWRMFSKEDFSFVADTVVAAGGIAAIVDYDLMPAVRLHAIIAQVRRAAEWLVANAAGFGGDAKRFTVSGHSAGAHLCCSLLDTDAPVRPQGAVLLSGIYDLAPLQTSFLKPLVDLTDDEVARFSPVSYSYRPESQIRLMVGEQETMPFHTQADAMLSRFISQGAKASFDVLADTNHMSIVLDLGDASTDVGSALTQMVTSGLLTL